MDKLVKYQNEVNNRLGSLETRSFSEMTVGFLLEKQEIADAILNDMKKDELQDSTLFEQLLSYANELVRAEKANDRIDEMTEELLAKWRRSMHHVLTQDEFMKILLRFVTKQQKLQIMEQLEVSYVFDKIVDRALTTRKINPKILELDPNKEYRIDELEEIDEVEAMKAQKEAFNFILIEEEKLSNYTNDYFLHKAGGIKKMPSKKDQDKEFFKIYSITIGRGYTPMFMKGESFEYTDGQVYTVYDFALENRYPTRNVLMGRLDENAELKLRVRIPVHIQVYICVKEKS